MVPLFDLLVVLRIKAKGGSILTRGGSVYEGALDSLVIRFSIQAFEVLRYLGFTSTLRVSSVNVVLLTDAASACLHPCCCSFRYKMLNPGLSMPVCGLPIPNRFCVFTSCLVLLPHKSPTNRSKLCHLFFWRQCLARFPTLWFEPRSSLWPGQTQVSLERKRLDQKSVGKESVQVYYARLGFLQL